MSTKAGELHTMPNYDLLIYRDMTDHVNETPPSVGDRADFLAEPEMYVAAIGPPIHEGKDATIVLKHDHRPDAEIQKLLDAERR